MAYISFQPNDHFNTLLYTGNNSTTAKTGVGFQPDMVWFKSRNGTTDHAIFDAVRGVTKEIRPNKTDYEDTASNGLTAFGTDGFTIGDWSVINANSTTYASWNWKANVQGSSNTDGSINTTYTSANTTAGFSICKWTGSGGNATIGHGLGAVPKMIIVKSLANSTSWMVYHSGIGNNSEIYLNGNNAAAGSSTAWQDTDPTSSVFYVAGSAGDGVNASGNYVAYCFAEKTGFSKVGSYKGNGSDNGTFVYTGFKPAFILVKNAAITDNWSIFDSKRLGYNAYNYVLYSDITNVGSNGLPMDILSNGFKWRTSAAMVNGSGNNCIYMAFAEEPLVASNGTPATAR